MDVREGRDEVSAELPSSSLDEPKEATVQILAVIGLHSFFIGLPRCPVPVLGHADQLSRCLLQRSD